MTRRTVPPSHDDVQLAIKHLAEAIGKPPTVLAPARHRGLADTTLRRHSHLSFVVGFGLRRRELQRRSA